ncbi:MAG: prolyl oligopeptidase family serine peptidase [Lentisphaerae bacterium]|nr:prolyl oligopeptidase family serine peptidase [Lentisphaerota bacterium]
MTRLFAIALAFAIAMFAGDTVRPGLEPLETSYYIDNEIEEKLVEALKQPLLEGLDVEAALQDWFDGRLLHTQNKEKEAEELWQKALGKLKDLKQLPIPEWKPIPEAKFTMLQKFKLPQYPDVLLVVVQWEVDKLKQYGILMVPVNTPKGAEYPLILYCHGAAAGIPLSYFYGWLADLAMQGYVVIGPAMRGEPLFQSPIKINGEILSCEGEIENLDGEVNDCLSMINAAWKLPFVRKNEFAMVGHSFGSGAGLLAAARANEYAKAVVSYDAWLVNPQRYYWDRMARRANNWLSWADFCNQPVKNQLQGLMTRSIVHNAHKLKCPLLFFIGGAYEGSVFHQSHDDLHKNLKKHNIPYTYEIIEGGGHNFVLYTEYEESKKAFKIQTEFLKKHYPPYKPDAER